MTRKTHTPLRRSVGRSDDTGSATILGVGLMAVVMMIGWGGVLFAGAIEARHRAAGAADLAALAGAAQLVTAEDFRDQAAETSMQRTESESSSLTRRGQREARACAVAAEVARRNAAAMVSCSVRGAVVDVRVTVEPRSSPLARLVGRVSAEARAGPPPVRSEVGAG